jgi:hypothetical protein
VVSMLVTGIKVHELKPGQWQWILMAITIHSTPSFRGEVKLLVPCHKILGHIKEPYKYEKRYFVGKIHSNFSPRISCIATRCLCWLLPDSFGGWIWNDKNPDADTKQTKHGSSVWDALYDTTP